MTWQGDLPFLYKQLILKDFRIRYRNMSLGVFWSLINPLVMMGVLTFVFTKIFPSAIPHFPVFVLCGIIPFNFFSLAWSTGTTAITSASSLVKRVAIPREVVPLAAVLSLCPHLLIQLGLLFFVAVLFGAHPGIQWLWFFVVWTLEIIFVAGLALMFSALNVYVQDLRYFVESANTILFWMVPIFYGFSTIPRQYADAYQYNPVAAIVLAMRNIILESKSPAMSLMLKLAFVSLLTIVAGYYFFSKLQRRFYEHL